MPLLYERKLVKDVEMNLILVILEIAVLMTVLFAYGRE